MTPLSTKLKELRTVAENPGHHHYATYTKTFEPTLVIKLITALEECYSALKLEERRCGRLYGYLGDALERINSMFQESGGN